MVVPSSGSVTSASLTLKGSLQLQVMDELQAQEGRGTPIRGLRWDCYQWGTSWNICCQLIHHQVTRGAAASVTVSAGGAV